LIFDSQIDSVGRDDQVSVTFNSAITADDHQLVLLDAKQLSGVDVQPVPMLINKFNDCTQVL